MNRDSVLLKRICEECAFIEQTCAHIDKNGFLADAVLQHAVCMSLIVIGESAHHLSESFTSCHNDIEWLKIIGVRNIAAHGYWQLDMALIWQAVTRDIPAFKQYIEAVLAEIE